MHRHKGDKKWMMNAWLTETMKPAADRVKPVLQKILPMKMMMDDDEDEDGGGMY